MATELRPELSYQQLYPLALHCLRRKKSVLLLGSPGNGKSTMGLDLAKDLGLPLIDLRVSMRDPGELAGIQMPNSATKTIEWYPPDWLRSICDQPALLLMDEINAGTLRLTLSICYQIMLDRKLGPFSFHPETVILATGNLPEDRSIVVDLPDALTDRCAKFILRTDVQEWLKWANAQTPALALDICGYLAWKGNDALYKRYEDVIASPRSWTAAAQTVAATEASASGSPSHKPLTKTQRTQLIGSFVGMVAAREVEAFSKVFRSVNIPGLLKDGIQPTFTNDDPGLVYAFVYALVDHIKHQKKPLTDQNFEHLAGLFNLASFKKEYQILLLLQIELLLPRLFSRLIDHPAFEPHCKDMAERLTLTSAA